MLFNSGMEKCFFFIYSSTVYSWFCFNKGKNKGNQIYIIKIRRWKMQDIISQWNRAAAKYTED